MYIKSDIFQNTHSTPLQQTPRSDALQQRYNSGSAKAVRTLNAVAFVDLL